MSSIANGVPNSNKTSNEKLNESELDTIDFLHFIRYMNVIYKSDLNVRLKFLYGVCMSGKIFSKINILSFKKYLKTLGSNKAIGHLTII